MTDAPNPMREANHAYMLALARLYGGCESIVSLRASFRSPDHALDSLAEGLAECAEAERVWKAATAPAVHDQPPQPRIRDE